MTARSGTVPSSVVGPDRRTDISRRAGEANLQDGALGLGDPQPDARVGKQRAVWAYLNINAGNGNYDLVHALKAKPVGVELHDVLCPPGGAVPDVSVVPLRYSEWTETVAKVTINVRSGSAVGCTARIIVRGA